MLNFIPVAFSAEEDTCPVCIARVNLEAALEAEAEALAELNRRVACAGGLSEPLALTWEKLNSSFSAMLADYRVSFAVNLAIWFSAERYGRAKKVPDLIRAYDEYRRRVSESIAAYQCAFDKFASEASPELVTAHEALKPALAHFWEEVDKWTDGRRDEALKLI